MGGKDCRFLSLIKPRPTELQLCDTMLLSYSQQLLSSQGQAFANGFCKKAVSFFLFFLLLLCPHLASFRGRQKHAAHNSIRSCLPLSLRLHGLICFNNGATGLFPLPDLKSVRINRKGCCLLEKRCVVDYAVGIMTMKTSQRG